MNLKKEVRLLLVDEIEGYVVAVVIRGFAGIEGAMVFESCSKLRDALKSKKGLLAEVNYVIKVNVCDNLDFKSLPLTAIEDKDILMAVIETKKMLSLAKLRFIQLKIGQSRSETHQ